MLEVGNAHTLYYEEVGTPAGIPAVYLHGGPGSGSTPGARRNFDPETYHAVFDQRGCGRSRPLASDARALNHLFALTSLVSPQARYIPSLIFW